MRRRHVGIRSRRAAVALLALAGLTLPTTPGRAVPNDLVLGSPQRTDGFARVNVSEDAREESGPPGHREAPGPQSGPGDLPVPARAPAPEPPLEPATEPAPGPGPEGEPPTVATSFQGLGDDNTVIPPDTMGAVGPSHVVTMLNSQVRFHTRAGGTISTSSLDSFWFSGARGPFDPRIVYDPYGSRWIAAAVTDRNSASSSLLIAVTTGSDPTGTWCQYSIDADTGDSTWADYPTLGFNTNWIVIGANMFNNSDNAYSVSKVWAWPRSATYGCPGSVTGTVFSMGGLGSTHQPAVTYDSSLATEYLVNRWNASSGTIRVFSITGPVTSPAITSGAMASAPSGWSAGPASGGDFAPQLGTSSKVQANDDRMGNVVYRNGALWAAHTIFLPAGGSPTRSSIQWWQVTPAGSITQRGLVDDPSGAKYFAFPSIAVNSINDVLVGYSRFSGSQYASANYSFRYGVDPAHTLQADTVLKAGEAPYAKTYGGTRNRWGDYSSTVVDPVNDTDMWTLQEYAWTAGGGFDRWATWWGRIAPSGTPGATPSPSSLAFGERFVGTTSPTQAVTVTNSGSASLAIGSVTLAGGDASHYSKTTDGCSGASIVPGASCSVGVAFAPTSTGAKSASVSIPSNAPGSPHAVPLTGTGVQAGLSLSTTSLTYPARYVGSTSPAQSVIVTSTGTGALAVSSVSLGGPNPGDFVKGSDTCAGASIAPGGTCSVGLSFSPKGSGARAATISIASNAPGGPHTVTLGGTGLLDTTPPSTTITSPAASGAVLIGGLSSVAGTSTDSESGAASVTVSFQPLVGAASSVLVTLSCGVGSCPWSVVVPIVLLPGPYTIVGLAADASGNIEGLGPTNTRSALVV